jgi:hypothetical protein
MSDPFKTTTKQELDILGQAKKRANSSPKAKSFNSSQKNKEEKKEPTRVSGLYNAGIALLEARGFSVELCEGGDHVNHRILKPSLPPQILGVKYPNTFMPLQDISDDKDFEAIEAVFHPDICEAEVRDFWSPLFRPKPGDNDLQAFTERRLKMKRVDQTKNIHQVLNYGHTFDPAGRWGGEVVLNPRIWVPDKDWFDPALSKVNFSDVFTIFPEAEQEMLRLILGRIGIGRANHLPPGRAKAVDHTARMAGVIVGKDAGLGKSTLFNGLTAALQRCGFVTHTFKSTEDRFGLKTAALSDVA